MSKIRLNLGSGSDYRDGFVNVDVKKEFKADVYADLSKKFPFGDNYADEIECSDILEHFTKEKGIEFLSECHRVLKTGGVLKLRTHNIFQIFHQFKNDPQVLIHFIYGDTQETGVFGSHKYAYTKNTLSLLLKKIGFNLISFENETTNFRIIASKLPREIRKISVGIIQQAPDIGGAEQYTLLLAKQFKKQGCNIFFATNNKLFEKLLSLHVNNSYQIPMRLDIIGNLRGLIKSTLLLPFAIIFYFNLLSNFKKRKVDVILMSGFSEKMIVTFLSPIFKIPVVWIEFGPLRTIFERNFYIPKIAYVLLGKIVAYVIVPALNTKQDLIVHGKVSLAKLMVIPCGVEIGKKYIRNRDMIPDWKGKFIIGNVSRLTREKGQEYIIRAAPMVLSKHPSARFILIGDGPDKEYFEDLIKKLRLEDKIRITGRVDSVEEYYKLMDIFVFPTVWPLEGFGLVIPEAMANCVPVVASNLGPVPEIIKDNINGLLFRPGDEKQLASVLIGLMDNSKRRKEMGQSGFLSAKKNYDIEVVSRKIYEIMEDASL